MSDLEFTLLLSENGSIGAPIASKYILAEIAGIGALADNIHAPLVGQIPLFQFHLDPAVESRIATEAIVFNRVLRQ